MVHCFEGKYFIEYPDFVDLINCGGWVLRKRMKDDWNAMNHLDYLWLAPFGSKSQRELCNRQQFLEICTKNRCIHNIDE